MPRDAWKFADDFTSVVTQVNLQYQWFRLNILTRAAIFNFMSSIGAENLEARIGEIIWLVPSRLSVSY